MANLTKEGDYLDENEREGEGGDGEMGRWGERVSPSIFFVILGKDTAGKEGINESKWTHLWIDYDRW
jgi:hypothetical protein